MWRSLVCRVVVTGLVTFSLCDGATAFVQKDDEPKKATVTGTIEFTGEPTFEADTVARVMVQDVSLADAPARKLGEQRIKNLKKFPIAFEVEYDPAVIKRGHTYAIQVRIETKGRLDYINDTRIEVISNNKPSKNVKAPVIQIKR